MTIRPISFSIPVLPSPCKSLSLQNRLNRFVELYLGCWSKEVAQVDNLNKHHIHFIPNPTTSIQKALIGISYALSCGLLPLIILIAKCILRGEKKYIPVPVPPPPPEIPEDLDLTNDNSESNLLALVGEQKPSLAIIESSLKKLLEVRTPFDAKNVFLGPISNQENTFFNQLLGKKNIDYFLEDNPSKFINPIDLLRGITKILRQEELSQPTLNSINSLLNKFPLLFNRSKAPQLIHHLEQIPNAAVAYDLGMGVLGIFWAKEGYLLCRLFDTACREPTWLNSLEFSKLPLSQEILDEMTSSFTLLEINSSCSTESLLKLFPEEPPQLGDDF